MNVIPQSYNWAYPPTKRTAKITRIILHHAAAKTCTAQQIHSWHLANKWAGIGYHYFIRKDGSIYKGRPDDTIGAHAGNNNSDSIGICFEGNFDNEQMNDVQKKAGIELVASLRNQYGISKIQKHSDVNATGCPGKNFPFDEIVSGKATSSQPSNNRTERTVNVTVRQLSSGMRGGDVRALQAILNAAGYNCGAADGIFGANTASALKRMQKSRGIGVDGIAGKDTWSAILSK